MKGLTQYILSLSLKMNDKDSKTYVFRYELLFFFSEWILYGVYKDSYHVSFAHNILLALCIFHSCALVVIYMVCHRDLFADVFLIKDLLFILKFFADTILTTIFFGLFFECGEQKNLSCYENSHGYFIASCIFSILRFSIMLSAPFMICFFEPHGRSTCNMFPCITGLTVVNSPEGEEYYEQALQQLGYGKIERAAAERAIGLFKGAVRMSMALDRIALIWSNVALLYLEIGDSYNAELFERSVTYAYEVAAERGYFDAMVEMGLRFEHGRGVARSEEDAEKWNKRVARQFNAAHKVEMLASHRHRGIGMVRNEARAVELYERAAMLGNATSQWEMAQRYETGNGVELNYQRAAELYTLAAAQKHVPSIHGLGLCYAKGRGVVKDDAHAMKLFEKAAAMGYSDSRYELGVCLEKCQGIENEKRAVKLYQLAAENYHKGAQKKLILYYSRGFGVDEESVRNFLGEEGEEGVSGDENV